MNIKTFEARTAIDLEQQYNDWRRSHGENVKINIHNSSQSQCQDDRGNIIIILTIFYSTSRTILHPED